MWTVLVFPVDNILRPILIRTGADLPLLLIFAGVIGGLISFGVVGIFVGPVVRRSRIHCLLNRLPYPCVFFDLTNRHRFVNPSCKQCIRDRQNDGADKNPDDSKGDQSANHAGKDQQQGKVSTCSYEDGAQDIIDGRYQNRPHKQHRG